MNLREPTTVKNVLTQEEINNLVKFWKDAQDSNSFSEMSISHAYRVWPIRKNHEAYNIISSAIDKILGHKDWEWIGSRINSQLKPSPKIHKDDAHAEDNPDNLRLTVQMTLEKNYNAHTVIFNQTHYGLYHFDYLHWLSGKQFGMGNPGEEVNDLEDGFVISEEDYKEHLYHFPKEKLKGLSINKVLNWGNPGDTTIFRSNNLHSPGASVVGDYKISATSLIKMGVSHD